MQFLKRILGMKKEPGKIFMLGLDGLGLSWLSLADKLFNMPTLARILNEGAITRLTTPLPLESQVAWASYATGQNPGGHGVFGLIDRNPNPFETFITSSLELASPTIWEIISQNQIFSGVMNVPLTYPPRPLNGIMVSCSLTPGLDLAHASWPMDIAPRLMESNYRIEADNTLALAQPEEYLADLADAMRCRFRAAIQMMRAEPWSFWQLHDLTIDRLNRFFYLPSSQAERFSPELANIYRQLDACLAELLIALPPNCRLVMASTHGFRKCQSTFMLNYWLEKNGYLHFAKNHRQMNSIHPNTRAYSLAPGRVFINLAGREEMGSVASQDYEDLCGEIANRLNALTQPNSQEPVFSAVYRRGEIYHGSQLDLAADLILQARDGIDLRSNLNAGALWQAPLQAGQPAPEDGFVFIQNMKTEHTNSSMDIIDLAPTLLNMLGIATPPTMEGQARV